MSDHPFQQMPHSYRQPVNHDPFLDGLLVGYDFRNLIDSFLILCVFIHLSFVGEIYRSPSVIL